MPRSNHIDLLCSIQSLCLAKLPFNIYEPQAMSVLFFYLIQPQCSVILALNEILTSLVWLLNSSVRNRDIHIRVGHLTRVQIPSL